ncbi:hypothetical protein AbraIFM66950_009438 [Aspergillus brasiliensis]|nr:hypothetical protein AbraIFM66950_009438 [Aspergillus brasiliensis]
MGKVEDIKEIEKIGGSLTRGLLMVLKFLPRRPKSDEDKSQTKTLQPSVRATGRVRVYEAFDVERYKKMGDFVQKHLNERETVYDQQLCQLYAESPPPRGQESHPISTDKVANDVTSDPGSIAALKSFANLQGPESQTSAAKIQELVEQGQAETLDRDCEAPTSILENLTAKVIGQGFLDPVSVAPVRSVTASGKKRQGVRSVIWKNENFQNTEYSYELIEQDKRQRHIYINYCELLFPSDIDILDRKVFIKIELCPPGNTHINPYAISSSKVHGDPALRLAFRVRYHDSFGREVVYYATNAAIGMVFKANTLVEVLEKKSLEDISQSSRRYIYIGGESTAHPSLERYKHGAYTSPLPR